MYSTSVGRRPSKTVLDAKVLPEPKPHYHYTGLISRTFRSHAAIAEHTPVQAVSLPCPTPNHACHIRSLSLRCNVLAEAYIYQWPSSCGWPFSSLRLRDDELSIHVHRGTCGALWPQPTRSLTACTFPRCRATETSDLSLSTH
jgi:hypothetical protein